ncbi:hypothetical protein F5884DRAFT_792569 [Xylogone sp. PMI_703]|nr:hypothetical protein F5884DRAFT_792569 [Xylogone sp. PMI_703]
MSQGYQTPDLASVLRTLASLAPQNQQQNGQQNIQNVQYPPTSFQTQPRPQAVMSTSTPLSDRTPTPTAPIIDPATITEWSAGLRCVMKIVSKNDNILQEIKKMIKVQHEHEEQWWRSREALIERQKQRKEGQKKLEEVLKAVGGAPTQGVSSTDPEELAKELKTFDMKVWKAQDQMVEEMTARMKAMGIPFFGTKPELVRKKDKEGVKANSDGPGGVIDETQLLELQRKVLTLLEEMCQD